MEATSFANTPEFLAYKEDPSTITFHTVLQLANVRDETNELLEALRSLAFATGEWRVSQHAAVLLLDRSLVIHAEFFAHRAIEQSNGDPFARCALAEILWERRLPTAVYYQVDHIRPRSRRLKDRRRKRLLQSRVAQLMVRSATYLVDFRTALPWLQHVRRYGGSPETWLQVLFAAAYSKETQIHYEAATQLAGVTLQGRAEHLQRLGVRLGLLSVLRKRHP